MKIVFFTHVDPAVRREPLSYSALQTTSGFSGTETAVMHVAHYLVGAGHRVHVLIPRCERRSSDGIHFGPPSVMDDPGFRDDIDVYSPVFFVWTAEDAWLRAKLRRHRTVYWLWPQSFVDDNHIRIVRSEGLRVAASFLCPYQRDNYDPSLFDAQVTIGNGVGPPFDAPHTPLPPPSERRGNWVFHASFERGGNVAARVMDRVRRDMPDAARHLHLASYFTPDDHRALPVTSTSCQITRHGSLSKTALADLLARCDYFVYPLVMDTGQVHHDTYACCVLEALARGVIVVTWNVACMPSVYGDNVVRVDPRRDNGYNPNARFAHNPWMLSDDAVDALAAAVMRLEADPAEKERVRRRGMDWARTQTWRDRGAAFDAWLKTLE
jgi:glycosyltransferase involved in cell wall biosynthesis